MWNWLNTHNNFWYSQVMVLLESWAMHKSKNFQTWFKKIGLYNYLHSSYSPDFALVEMWLSLIKSKLTEIDKEANSNISVKNNYAKIFDSLLPIKSKTVRNMFAKFFKTIQ